MATDSPDRRSPPGQFGPSTIPAALASAAERFSGAPWMAFRGEVQTFTDLARQVESIAIGLLALGVRPGDRVGLFMGNGFEWLQIEYAVTSLGAALVPLNTALRQRELEHIIDKSEMNMLIWGGTVVGRDTRPLLDSLLPELEVEGRELWQSSRFPALRRVVGFGDGEWRGGVTPWSDLMEAANSEGAERQDAAPSSVSADDVALIMFTSGTTGSPKGALLRHGSIVDHLAVWCSHVGLGPQDRSILASPLFWTFGCSMNAMVPLLAGSMIVLDDQFEPERFLGDLITYKCTHLQGVPTHYELALNHPKADQADLTSMRLIQIGGVASIEGLVRRIGELMPQAKLVSSYGLTEAVICSTWTDLEDSLEDIIGTVGHAAPDNEIQLRDVGTNAPVPPGEVGVIWLRGPNVTNGYLGDPIATQASIVDGWLNTGDLAISDARGYLSIVGRSVDAFKRGGANVYPAEIEVVLGEHQHIKKAAVIGVPDPIQGEIGVAYVVKRPGAPLSAQDVIDFCRSEMATYKVPAHVRFVDTLPETPTGKVQKYLLREAWTPSSDPSPVAT